jgi:hypothetical protein
MEATYGASILEDSNVRFTEIEFTRWRFCEHKKLILPDRYPRCRQQFSTLGTTVIEERI